MPSSFLIAKPAELFIAEIRVQLLPGLHVDFSLESFVNNPRYFCLPFMEQSKSSYRSVEIFHIRDHVTPLQIHSIFRFFFSIAGLLFL